MTACRYCGLEMGAQRLPNHEARCPRNPEMFARLREFMQEWAEDGIGMSATLYADFAKENRLTPVTGIVRAFGSWGDFVRTCGLEHRPYFKGHGELTSPELMPGSVMANTDDIWPTSVLRCIPARIPIREWSVTDKRYVTVAEQTVWRVR